MSDKIKYKYRYPKGYSWDDIPPTGAYRCKLPNDTIIWVVDRKHHRMDGPAVVAKDGQEKYMIRGHVYAKQQYYQEIYRRGLITEADMVLEML